MRKRKNKFNKFIEHFTLKTLVLFFLDAIVISLSFLFTVILKNDFNLSFDLFNLKNLVLWARSEFSGSA